MYGLYRAWFGNGDEGRPRLESLSPPDTLVRVGNEGQHQFVAHRVVLAAHSGYLKALLATSTTSGHEELGNTSSGVTSISVSSVGGEAFAPLLDYMYTGRLDVSPDNIYSVLLATHLLHMPGALEQCRGALLRLRGPPPPPLPTTSQTDIVQGAILRPVPSRPVGSNLCWSQQTNLYPSPHLGLSHLADLRLSTGLGVLSNTGIIREANTASLTYSFRENVASSPPRSTVPGIDDNPDAITNTSRIPSISSVRCSTDDAGERWTPEAPRNEAKDARSNDDDEESEKIDEDDRNNDEGCCNVKGSASREINIDKSRDLSSNDRTSVRHANVDAKIPRTRNPKASSSSSSPSSMAIPSTSNGVVYDVACCDGPVRFHRVLNENYVSTSSSTSTINASRRTIRRNSCEQRSDEERDDNSARRATIVENDENGKPPIVDEHGVVSGGTSGPGGIYTCGYCRHTFKSQYCYRKHARRHLLPSSETETNTRINDGPERRHEQNRRREVKPLDLNVQYYPCKICGSKFPSYYFVHKHRKLCHASVDERAANSADDDANVHRNANESIDP